MDDKVLSHAGVKGMKWGVRRYQNKDGSLTPAGKKRYGYDMKRRFNKVVKTTKKQIQTAVDKHTAKKEAEKAAEEEAKKRDRPTRSLTDDELRVKINRLSLERQALDLERQVASLDPKAASAGQNFIKEFASKAITPALMDAGKRVATDFLTKKGKDLLGLSDTNIDPYKELKKSVEGLNLQKQKRDLEKALRGETDSDEELAKTAKRMANEETIARLKKQREDREKSERASKEGAVEGEGKSSSNAKTKYDTSSEPEIIIDDMTIVEVKKSKQYQDGKRFINEMFD